MANVKISELNELLGHQKAYEDVIPIVDTSANETKKISVKGLIPSNVKLIAITDTAPVEYETGDKYYNTTTDKIYTGTSLDWESPEDPVPDIFYVILDEQKTYTYDNINHEMISVGGGGGGGIAVYPDEPEEDTKLYIEEEDLDFQGLPIADERTTGDNVAYSADYSNSAFGGTILWTNPSPTSNFAGQDINLSSSDYDMLLWVFSTGTSNSQYISFYTIKGKGVYASWVYNSTFLAREINYSTDTQYAVGDNKTNGTTNNASTIPQYVIGYKTGLFS